MENNHLRHKKIGVIGGSQGLGSWMVHFFRNEGCEVKFTSADENSEVESNQELIAFADVIMLCVPISNMIEVLEECFPYLHQKALFEVCSVKKFIVDRFNELSEENPTIECAFYSVHPMYSQRQANLKGQVLINNFQHNGNDQLFQAFCYHFERHGAVWYNLPYQEHDKLMGVVQGLNHFNVFVSSKTLQRAGFDLEGIKSFASPTYRIFIVFFTRYVLQNPRLYAEIQLFNEYVLETLKLFKEEVDKLYQLIAEKREEEFIEYVSSTQPFFESNSIDKEISNHLIEQLGISLSEKEERSNNGK